jgi:hypothetical protein
MPDQLKTLLIITGVVLVFFALWAISIGTTYWDIVSRRKLAGIEIAAWMALVVLIPGIGFAAYWFVRLLERLLTGGVSAEEKPRWVTILKHKLGSEWQPGVSQAGASQTGTIAAADLFQPPSSEIISTQMTRAVLEKVVRRYKLTIIAGPHSGAEYGLDNFPVKIGRGREVSIALNEDQGVSRLHAEIYEQIGALWIRDMKSTHGTKVNDVSIDHKSLDPGDRIQVGATTFSIEVQAEHL